MKRLVAMVVAAGAAVAAVAMPTKAELQKAQEMVNDVTAADVAALKAKTKKPTEVAAKHMELAGQAGSEAEKYLLLQAAFKLYAKAGDYDAAANVIEKLQVEITDYDPEITVELCGAEFIRKMRENAPRLYALKENARRIVFYRKQLPIREAAVKKNPKDPQTQRKLAECHAELGDWPKALEVFVQAGGEFKKMAEGETNGKVPAQELGDFWWDYETKSDTAVYKLHAAELYRKALADGSFKGLVRTRAEQRVKEVDTVAPDLPWAKKTDRVAKEDGDYIWFVPSSKADWSVSDTEPDKKWLGLGFQDVLQWKVVHGAYRTDKENSTKWLRTKADWGFDPKMIEKAEIEYVVDGKATVWLNGGELADLVFGATPRDRDITASFIKAISVGRNVLAVKFTNNGGKGICDIGIRVKLAKKPVISKEEKPISFELAKGIDLEMVACPAGTFKMSNAPGGPNGDGTHEVKLTRTYWIASSCVTRAMYKAFEADYDKDEKKDGEKKPDDLVKGHARAEAFASWLNKRFQSKLPHGYVFRLPSEAEWEYAMNTGVVARHWGFEGTLDTVRAVSEKAYAWKFDVSVMDYAAKESDPLRICSQNPAWVCRQSGSKPKRFLLRMDGDGCFRMVVGPDLIAEKKAKK